MKRTLLILVLCLFAAGMLFAAGEKEEGAAGEEKVTIDYMMWDPQIIEKEEALALEFSQENPNITVNVEAAAYNQFWEKMQAMAAAKNLPDAFWMSSGEVKDWAAMGAIMNIQKYVDQMDKSQYFTSAFNVLKAPNFQGDMYAFPWAVVACISYYNIRMYDEAGLAYPETDWTWDDMLANAEKLSQDTDGDGAFDEWGYWVKGRYTHLYPYIYNNGVAITDPAFEDFLAASTDAGKAGFKYLTDMIVEHKYSPTPAQTKGVSTFFTTGKVGMCTEGSWRISTYRGGLEDPFGINLVPLGPDAEGHTVFGWADAMSISAFTDYGEEAWKWIMFMSGPGRPIDSILGGKVPVYKTSAMSDTWLEQDMLPDNKGLVLDAIDLIGEQVTLPPGFSEWNKTVESTFEEYVLKGGDFEQTMEELETQVERVLARRQ